MLFSSFLVDVVQKPANTNTIPKEYNEEHIKYKPKIISPNPNKTNSEINILFLESFSRLATRVFK
jgi:hypothetical protein